MKRPTIGGRFAIAFTLVLFVILFSGCGPSAPDSQNPNLTMRVTAAFPCDSASSMAWAEDGKSFYFLTTSPAGHLPAGATDQVTSREVDPSLKHHLLSSVNLEDSTISTKTLLGERHHDYWTFRNPLVVATQDGVIVVATSTNVSFEKVRFTKPLAYVVWLDKNGEVKNVKYIVCNGSLYATDGAIASDGSLLICVSHSATPHLYTTNSLVELNRQEGKERAGYSLLRLDKDGNEISRKTWEDKRDLSPESSEMLVECHADGTFNTLMYFKNDYHEWRLARLDAANNILWDEIICSATTGVDMIASTNGSVVLLTYAQILLDILDDTRKMKTVGFSGDSEDFSAAVFKVDATGKTEWIAIHERLFGPRGSGILAPGPSDGSSYWATTFVGSVTINSSGNGMGLKLHGPRNSLALVNFNGDGTVKTAEVVCHSVFRVYDLEYSPQGALGLLVTGFGKTDVASGIRNTTKGILGLPDFDLATAVRQDDTGEPLTVLMLEIPLTNERSHAVTN